jgi:hypothetical protein
VTPILGSGGICFWRETGVSVLFSYVLKVSCYANKSHINAKVASLTI